MGEKMSEAEVVDDTEEIDTLPVATGVVGGGLAIEDQIVLAENIGKMVEAQNKIRMALLGLAQKGDWVVFGNGENEKAELGFAGSMRIGATLGVSYTNWAAEKEVGTDEKGSWYRWNYECDAIFRGRTVRTYGRASSRDKFFGKVRGEYKALHDIDEGNIRMAARRGAMKEGIKVLFGLHHFEPDTLKKHGVRLEGAMGHEFKSAEKAAEETQSVTVKVADVRMKKGDNWTKYTIIDVEGASYSTFSETAAKTAKDAKEGGKDVTISFTRGKYGNEIKSIA